MIKPPQREREHSFNDRGRWFKVPVSVVEISMAEQALNHIKVMSLLDQTRGAESLSASGWTCQGCRGGRRAGK